MRNKKKVTCLVYSVPWGRFTRPEAVCWAQGQPSEKLRLRVLIPGTRGHNLILEKNLRGCRG